MMANRILLYSALKCHFAWISWHLYREIRLAGKCKPTAKAEIDEEEYISRRRMYDFNGTTLSLPWIIRKMRKSELTKYAHIDRIRIGVILEKGRNSYEAKGLFFING